MKHVALDTEFVRTNTFYARLGLIQLAGTGTCFLVDPIPFPETSTLTAFLNSNEHIFVVHSCSEDLNLLYTSLGVIPNKIFDTQLAAAFLGIGFSLSYQALVEQMLGKTIPKDETRSDWLRRPLSETQMVYAATDVEHLLALRELLEAQLRAKGVFEWFVQDCQDLLGIAPASESEASWQDNYTGINNAWRLNDLGLEYLHRLCIWREQEARRRDKPRNWIAKDADLLQIAAGTARQGAPTPEALASLEGVDKPVLKRYARDLSQLLADITESARIDRNALNAPLSTSARKKLKECQHAVQELAAQHAIAPELLGRKKVIMELVREFEQGDNITWPASASGWRRALLEPVLTPILTR